MCYERHRIEVQRGLSFCSAGLPFKNGGTRLGGIAEIFRNRKKNREAWSEILHYLDTAYPDETEEGKVKLFFEAIDTDGSNQVDPDELSRALMALGVFADDIQTKAFKGSIGSVALRAGLADLGKGADVSLDQFTRMVKVERIEYAQAKREKKKAEVGELLRRFSSLVERNEADVPAGTFLQHDLSEWLPEEVVSMCAERVASRMMLDVRRKGGILAPTEEYEGKVTLARSIGAAVQRELRWLDPLSHSASISETGTCF